jgi:predicted nucleic acid-binding protein
MYLWDTNILRYFVEGQPILRLHLERITWNEIALPSVVVAEVLRGRSEYALKALPEQVPLAHTLLQETRHMLNRFNIILSDESSVSVMQTLQNTHTTHKRYADLMIAAIVIAGNHVLVTRNQKHFRSLLPKAQLMNWIDEKPM